MKKELCLGICANVDTAKLKSKKMDGKSYLVGPVVMAVEGVMNKLLYTAEELKKSVPRWNGRPVTNGHPKDAKGKFITANTPETLETTQLGFLFHVNFDEEGNKLKGECWIDKTKLDKFPAVNAVISKGGMLEVSTGLFLERTGDSGTFGVNEEEYIAEAVNHAPDHFALLPGDIGACSIEDGAGFPRANQQLETAGSGKQGNFLITDNDGTCHFPTTIDGKVNAALMGNAWAALHSGFRGHTYNGPQKASAIEALKELYGKSSIAIPVLNTAETSEVLFPDVNAVTMSTTSVMLNKAFGVKYKDCNNRPWVIDFTSDCAYYEQYNSASSGYDLYRISFNVDEKSNKINFVGDPVAVVRKVTYEDVIDANESKEGKPHMTRQEQVDGLIKANRFDEAQRAWLTGLPDDQFVAINKAITPATAEQPKATAPAANASAEQPKAVTTSPEVNEAAELMAELKGTHADAVLKVNGSGFTREELIAMPLRHLKKLAALAANAEQAPTADRTGLGGPGGSVQGNAQETTEAPLVFPVEKKA